MKFSGFWALRRHGLVGLLVGVGALAGCAHSGSIVAEDRRGGSDSQAQRLDAKGELLWERSIGARTCWSGWQRICRCPIA